MSLLTGTNKRRSDIIKINNTIMKVTIQTPGFKAHKTLTDFIETNLLKLETHGGRIEACQVLLKLDKSDERENKVCEVKLVIPGNDLFASKQSSTFEDAVLKSIEAIKHQISRWKDSVNHGKLRGADVIPE
jgi:putative sigma-54 modulation protein